MFILFINNKIPDSDVYLYGKKLFNLLSKPENTLYIYKEIENYEEFNNVINDVGTFIDFIIYNYDIVTMRWLNNFTINKKIHNLGVVYKEPDETIINFDKVYKIDNALDQLFKHDGSIINDFLKIIYSNNNNNIDNYIKLDNYKIDKSCYILVHGGFGDIIYNCGLINFLSHFYNKLYLFCPKEHSDKVATIFNNIDICIINYDRWYKQNSHVFWDEGVNTGNFQFLTDDWFDCAINYLYKELNNDNYDSFDWETYVKIYPDLSTRITNKEDAWHHWINFGKNEWRIYFETTKQEFDCFTTGTVFLGYHFLSSEKKNAYNNFKFYTKISHPHIKEYLLNFDTKNLHFNNIWDMMPEFCTYNPEIALNIYYNYFNIPTTQKSIEIYETIKNYKLVFIHFISSAGKLEIPFNDFPHIKNEDYLIVDPDKNHYDPTNDKYYLVEKLLHLSSLDYLSIILNATDIYVVDSSFYAIIFGLRVTNKLNTENIIIYDRFYLNKKFKYFNPLNISRTKSLKQELEWTYP